MSLHRFLVPTVTLMEPWPCLPSEAEHHLKVIRPKVGERMELFDGCGALRTCCWDGTHLSWVAPLCRVAAPMGTRKLFACVTKGSRWDWTLEKATELGVTHIIPVLSARTIVRINPSEREAKVQRWRRIIEEAARQSDVAWLPQLSHPLDFSEVVALLRAEAKADAGYSPIVYVGALTTPPPPPMWTALAADYAAGTRDFGVFVGPEGDFAPEELAQLMALGHPVSMGPTILRAETAALYGVTLLTAVSQQTCCIKEKEGDV